MENPIWSECDHQAFIGTYKNVVDKKFCDDLIQFFENSIDRRFKLLYWRTTVWWTIY